MADTRLQNTDSVLFVLQYEEEKTYPFEREPEGWEEDALEIVRNEQYHGIVTQFTNGLKFSGYAKEFILDAYKVGGLNANLYLIKYVLESSSGYKTSLAGVNDSSIKWEEKYRGLADFETMKSKNNTLEINFNSDELEQILKTHESTELELGREKSLDDKELTVYDRNSVKLEGRKMPNVGESISTSQSYNGNQYATKHDYSIPTLFVTKGMDRHVEVTTFEVETLGDVSLSFQEHFFYDDIDDEGSSLLLSDLKITVDFDMKFVHEHFNIEGVIVEDTNIDSVLKICLFKFENSTYTKFFEAPLHTWDDGVRDRFQQEITINDVPYNWGIAFLFENTGYPTNDFDDFKWKTTIYGEQGYKIIVDENTKFEGLSQNHTFSFIHEAGTRLMEILTGKKFKFYSKLFGRHIGDRPPPSTSAAFQYQDYDYAETGEAGEVGLIHGFDIRRFSEWNPLYKTLTTSIKDLIESLQSVFNIGVGIESSRYGQRLRFEKLEHFYREKIVVKLPNQVINVERAVNKKMFYSEVSFGCEKGGDYEDGWGLDEPNVSATFITPLRKTTGKYTKFSKYRSDDYGMEFVRRVPEFLDEKQDRSEDEHIWFLDLSFNDNWIYTQKTWQQGLSAIPYGVGNPETYKSWRFTPKRSLLRHGWVIRAGMEQYLNMNKKITMTSSEGNKNLVTQINGDDPVSESADVLITSLERPIMLPELIKFTHPVNDALYNLIMGKTSVIIGGESELVPNWYFKFQWINENEELETGFLKSFKPKKNEFEFYKANNTKIY